MAEPYYEDDAVTLYQGRCEDILPGLSLTGSVHLLTDPPYFKVKGDDWDNQWGKAAEFLDWMGEWLDLAKPLLSADASVWVFASPELTSAVESVVAQRFRVLNSVRWVKEQGWHKKADLAAARSFLSPWEGVIFAEQFSESERSKALDESKAVWAEIGQGLADDRVRGGFSREDVAASFAGGHKNLAGAKARVSAWEIGNERITARAFEALSSLCELRWQVYDDLEATYDRADAVRKRDLESTRRPFSLSDRTRSTDVWNFENVASYPGKHPCEKPTGLLTHMIETTTRPGDTIIDCFAGSGAVLDVARQLGRKAVGIEMETHWCRQIEKRLSQQTFDLEGIA